MAYEWKLGSTVWIEHHDDGDVFYKVKLLLERQPNNTEYCKLCQNGQLSLMGHIIQSGILDDKIYAVTRCTHCCGVTVFIYHVEPQLHELPEIGECIDEKRDGA